MQPFHITRNLKMASAFATLGAEVLAVDQITEGSRTDLVFTLSDKAHGITCQKASQLWENKGASKLEDLVDGIIERRSITPEEFALIQLEVGRAMLGNRGVLLKTGMQKKALVSKSLKSGRQVVFRDGTPKEELRKLINS
jgi:hypothetical protein